MTEKDRLHVRDNLQLALSDAEKNKGHAILRAAGKGLKTAKQVFATICLSNFYQNVVHDNSTFFLVLFYMSDLQQRHDGKCNIIDLTETTFCCNFSF